MVSGSEPKSFFGIHVLAELYDVSPTVLNDKVALHTALKEALEKVNATICAINTHSFDPHGVTAVALLAESHASIHTYPEHGAAFFDLFTCGPADPAVAVSHFAQCLHAGKVVTSTVKRGWKTHPYRGRG